MEQLPENRVTVTGRASRDVVPDRAQWQLSVVERHAEEAGAYGACSTRLNALLARLRPAVGDDGVIQTSQLSVAPAWDDRGRRRVGHEAVGGLRVTVDVARAGEVAAAVMNAGADRLNGPTLFVDDRTAVIEELLAEAVESARRKAAKLAEAGGRRLGKAVRIEEGSNRADPYGTFLASPPQQRAFQAQSAPVAQVEAGEQSVEAVVTVVYELTGGA